MAVKSLVFTVVESDSPDREDNWDVLRVTLAGQTRKVPLILHLAHELDERLSVLVRLLAAAHAPRVAALALVVDAVAERVLPAVARAAVAHVVRAAARPARGDVVAPRLVSVLQLLQFEERAQARRRDVVPEHAHAHEGAQPVDRRLDVQALQLAEERHPFSQQHCSLLRRPAGGPRAVGLLRRERGEGLREPGQLGRRHVLPEARLAHDHEHVGRVIGVHGAAGQPFLGGYGAGIQRLEPAHPSGGAGR